ncbi:primosomal protein DnaI [Atopobacter phocae]|uniref:primosomal protein DnaI n=1 Tax=Atopobacter phocae TaxID=136492 RepID=UPI00046FB5CB|nr:primosomal protein DnaI [Atopobacter phocae]
MEPISKVMQSHLDKSDLSQRLEQKLKETLNYPKIKAFLADHEDVLTDAIIRSSSSRLYEFMSEDMKRQHNEPVANPHLEPVLKWTGQFIDCEYRLTTQYKQQMKRQKDAKRLRLLYLPKSLKQASFEAIYPEAERAQAIQALTRVYNGMTDGHLFEKGVYLTGPFGTGKTYLLATLAHELTLSGFEVTLVHYPTLVNEVKQTIGTTDGSMSQLLDTMKTVEVLMIDDIGAESNSSWVRDDILSVILQHRMQEELLTCFSSNLTWSELERHFTVTQRGEKEPLKALRLMERIKFLTEECHVTGKNYRSSE